MRRSVVAVAMRSCAQLESVIGPLLLIDSGILRIGQCPVAMMWATRFAPPPALMQSVRLRSGGLNQARQ
jgi:hypothetical protein